MDVVQVSHLYRPSIGGIENYAHRLTDSLQRNGHSVRVLTTDFSFQNDESPLDAPDEARYCETTVSLLRNPFSLELYRVVRRCDADVYHLHSPFFLPTVETVHALPSSTPTVLTIHGFPPEDTNIDRVRNAVYRPVVQYVLDRVDEIIVLGNAEMRQLTDRYDVTPDTVSVIPNGIHPEEHDASDRDIEQFRRRYNVDASTPTLLFVSRLVQWKNPDVLIDTVTSELAGRELDVLVVGTGEESYVSELQRRADERFRFLPNLPFKDLQTAYHAADVFVHLSRSEGLSTVVLEAMNASLPVVSTPPGALEDVLTHRETGWVLDPSPSTCELARALRHVLDDSDRLRKYGERNRAYVRAEFDWKDIADEIQAVYERVRDRRQ